MLQSNCDSERAQISGFVDLAPAGLGQARPLLTAVSKASSHLTQCKEQSHHRTVQTRGTKSTGSTGNWTQAHSTTESFPIPLFSEEGTEGRSLVPRESTGPRMQKARFDPHHFDKTEGKWARRWALLSSGGTAKGSSRGDLERGGIVDRDSKDRRTTMGTRLTGPEATRRPLELHQQSGGVQEDGAGTRPDPDSGQGGKDITSSVR